MSILPKDFLLNARTLPPLINRFGYNETNTVIKGTEPCGAESMSILIITSDKGNKPVPRRGGGEQR